MTAPGETSAPYLRLDNVAKSYDGHNFAVDHVSLDIRKGEFLTFLGPSGSGKTTTLTMIAGFEMPSEGRIFLDGRDLTQLPPWRRNIGMVFQNYALFPHMTVARNVAFPLRMRGIAQEAITTRVRDVLTLVGLDEFAARHPAELSGGQQQRVALARGLVFQPDLLLLDEPLGALDKNLREQMQLELKRIHREIGITMVYVTHDQTEAMTMSDRIAVFNTGRIEQLAPPSEIYARPKTRFVGSFVGDNNLLRGRLTRGPDGFAVEIDESMTLPVDAETVSELADGSHVIAMIRPENIRLTSDGVARSKTSSVTATVEQTINYGDTTVAICRNGTFVFRVRMLGQNNAPITDRTEVLLSWSMHDVHVIADR